MYQCVLLHCVVLCYFEFDSYQFSESVRADETKRSVFRSIEKAAPTRHYYNLRYNIQGMGGLVKLMQSSSGMGMAAKIAYINYCERLGADVGQCARFVDYCYKLQNCGSNLVIYDVCL